MSLVNSKSMLQSAWEGKYAVGAFNVVNLEFLEAIFETAVATSSPLILSIAEVHLPFVNLENICPIIRDMALRAHVPIALHLDHGVSQATVWRSLRNGFTSVMFDGSKLPFENNIAETRSIVELCHPLGVTVEAELGAVGGDEGGGLESQADPSLFTDPAMAKEFVDKTGVDALAVAIGNSHGKYKGEPKLDFARLQHINELCGIPLVLHGGSGISATDFKHAIRLGIAKINFYTGMSQAALTAASAFMAASSGRYHDYPLLMQNIKKAVAETVAEQIDIFGCSGQGR
ncbi:MAG: ketose 1,6-bisphosphate aldolase [Calditrichaeota bacterium]|nr:MAG: ketose 1,6-bisphosphate aldolase [Calditrichota bacterium]